MNDTADISVYILKQYFSDACRREIQLLSLKKSFHSLQVIRQAQGNPFPYLDRSIYSVRKPSNVTGIFKLLGWHKTKRALDRLYFPSPTVLYARAAQKALERKFKSDLTHGRRVCLVSPVPPHDLLVAGLSLKWKYPAIRWIVDWQDLWSYDEYYFGQESARWCAKVKRLEGQIFDRCDMNVVNNSNAQAVVRDHYGVPSDRCRVIPHAYDGEFLRETGQWSHDPDRPIHIGFLGNLMKPPKVPGQHVLDVLGRVRQRGIDLVFHILGDKYLEKVTRAPVKDLPWVTVHNRVGHEESLRQIAGCDFLLLALADLPNCRCIMHGKLPHYLMLDKPILALVPQDSAVASVIERTGTGVVIPLDEDCGSRLAIVLNDCRRNRLILKRDEEAIERYSWNTISKEWLDVIAKEGNRGPAPDAAEKELAVGRFITCAT